MKKNRFSPSSVQSRQTSRAAGFTIVELMIATIVFASIMVVVASGVAYFTKQYYLGVTRNKVQTTARSVSDSVSQAIQFAGNTYSEGGDYYCIGSKRFTIVKNKKLVDSSPATDETYHGVVIDQPNLCSGPKANIDATKSLGDPDASELLGLNMQLIDLKVEQTTAALFKVTVVIAYGDDDQFDNPNSPNLTCKGGAGAQFCAVSAITTTVQRRVGL